jgi:hypothetical protein
MRMNGNNFNAIQFNVDIEPLFQTKYIKTRPFVLKRGNTFLFTYSIEKQSKIHILSKI